MVSLWDTIQVTADAGPGWEWEEAPPGRGGAGDYPEREEITRTGAVEDEPYTEKPASHYYDDAINEDIKRGWDDAHDEDSQRNRQSMNPPYKDWQDLGQFKDYAGRTYNARFRQGSYNMIQAVDPSIDHSRDAADNDHEAVIKWDPYDGEIKWRGRNSSAHGDGFLTMALKHHAQKNLPEGVKHPEHSTNLTGAGRGSLEKFMAEHGDPYGDIEPALHPYNHYDDDDDDAWRDDDDDDNLSGEDDEEPEDDGRKVRDSEDRRRLESHGFEEDNQGQWNKSFIDPRTGDAIEKHTIQPDGRLEVYDHAPNGDWQRNREAGLSWSPSIKNSLNESRHGFAEAVLPEEGWTPQYRDPPFDLWNTMQAHQPPLNDPDRDTRHLKPYKWTKTVQTPHGDTYHHEIYMPEGRDASAYELRTSHNGGRPMSFDSGDLSGDIEHQARLWEKGQHPGGARDNRLTHDQLRDAVSEYFGRDPRYVYGLEHGTTQRGEPGGAERANRAEVYADRSNPDSFLGSGSTIEYNWNTGRYEGRPDRGQQGRHIIPGTQTTLPLESVSMVRVAGTIGRATDSIFNLRGAR